MQRCERLGCEAQWEVRVEARGRLRRFCSDACRARERRRNLPRVQPLPPLPPPVGWYPPSSSPSAFTPRLTRREALERWAEIVTAANAPHRAASDIHETDAQNPGDAVNYAHGHERDSASHRAGHERDSASHRKHKKQPTNEARPKTGQGENK